MEASLDGVALKSLPPERVCSYAKDKYACYPAACCYRGIKTQNMDELEYVFGSGFGDGEGSGCSLSLKCGGVPGVVSLPPAVNDDDDCTEEVDVCRDWANAVAPANDPCKYARDLYSCYPEACCKNKGRKAEMDLLENHFGRGYGNGGSGGHNCKLDLKCVGSGSPSISPLAPRSLCFAVCLSLFLSLSLSPTLPPALAVSL